MSKKKEKLPRTSPFIQKLALILQEQQQSSLINWLPCGTVFVILKPTDFASSLLPKYFKHKNYGSFLRQLNFYNFVKIHRATGSGHQFQHPLFLRGQQEKYRFIKSQRSKKDNCTRDTSYQSKNSEDQSQTNLPSLQVEIQKLCHSQTSLLNQCRNVIEQSIETIQWGLIRSAQLQNDSSHNKLICNRIFDFVDQSPSIAAHLAYLDTDLVHKLLQDLDTDIGEYFSNSKYTLLISEFLNLVQKNQDSLMDFNKIGLKVKSATTKTIPQYAKRIIKRFPVAR